MITVSPGYWRLSPLSTEMLTCPFPNACVGGNGTTGTGTGTSTNHGRRLSSALDATAGCAVGHQGPLCGVCLSNYYFDNTKQACLSCVGQGRLQLSITIIVPAIVFLFILAVMLLFPDLIKFNGKVQGVLNTELVNSLTGGGEIETNNIASGPSATGMGGRLPNVNVGELAQQTKETLKDNEKEGEEGDNPMNPVPTSTPASTPSNKKDKDKDKKKMGCFARFMSVLNVGKIMSKVKIVITAYQIVSALPFSLALSFPSVTDLVFHMLTFVNLSAITLGSPACYTSFDYFNRLMVATVVPLIVFGGVIFVFFPLHIWSYRRSGKDTTVLVGRYFFCILLLAYMFLPSVTTTIFGSFTCTNIDPEGLVPGTPTFLRNDYSISCNSNRYHQMVAWAVAMVATHPFIYISPALRSPILPHIPMLTHTSHPPRSHQLFNPCPQIFVYPVGFTSIYLVLLYRTRDEIMKKKNKGTRNSTIGGDNLDGNGGGEWSIQPPTSPTGGYDDLERMLQEGGIPPKPKRSYLFTDEISFLYEAYKPEYWYWEVSQNHLAGLGVVPYMELYMPILCVAFSLFHADTLAFVLVLVLVLVVALTLPLSFFYYTTLIGN